MRGVSGRAEDALQLAEAGQNLSGSHLNVKLILLFAPF
jgi:hypothetical protein